MTMELFIQDSVVCFHHLGNEIVYDSKSYQAQDSEILLPDGDADISLMKRFPKKKTKSGPTHSDASSTSTTPVRSGGVSPHTSGSKSLAKRKSEIEIEQGGSISKGATHKKASRSAINDAARSISEKSSSNEPTEETSSDESTGASSQKVSYQDVLATAASGSQEHSGPVQELGLSLCSSQVIINGHSTFSYGEKSSLIARYNELENQHARWVQHMDELNERQDRLEKTMKFLIEHLKIQLPPELASFWQEMPDQGKEPGPSTSVKQPPTCDEKTPQEAP
ncbi:LOB domain-containing protein 18-like [Senna tora]|uniref:LOB domain-containing protein 18-like n=1 Tax=Senna tora TaxID=362788 RepID=A0A835CM88_9FABA|nr:LOB domain-containing protein 18-like [Senna tora]